MVNSTLIPLLYTTGEKIKIQNGLISFSLKTGFYIKNFLNIGYALESQNLDNSIKLLMNTDFNSISLQIRKQIHSKVTFPSYLNF